MQRRKAPIKDEDRVIHNRENSTRRTMQRAVRLLAAKPRSVEELKNRLLEKPWTDQEIVNEILEKLKGYNYLNDKEFAESLAAAKLRQKPQGKRRLQFSLSQKQLSKDDIENAVSTAYEKMPEESLIDIAIEKRIRIKGFPKDHAEKKKLYDHLLRRGFSFDLIRSKVSSIDPEMFDVH